MSSAKLEEAIPQAPMPLKPAATKVTSFLGGGRRPLPTAGPTIFISFFLIAGEIGSVPFTSKPAATKVPRDFLLFL